MRNGQSTDGCRYAPLLWVCARHASGACSTQFHIWIQCYMWIGTNLTRACLPIAMNMILSEAYFVESNRQYSRHTVVHAVCICAYVYVCCIHGHQCCTVDKSRALELSTACLKPESWWTWLQPICVRKSLSLNRIWRHTVLPRMRAKPECRSMNLKEWINPLPSFCLFRLVCVLCVFLFCTASLNHLNTHCNTVQPHFWIQIPRLDRLSLKWV